MKRLLLILLLSSACMAQDEFQPAVAGKKTQVAGRPVKLTLTGITQNDAVTWLLPNNLPDDVVEAVDDGRTIIFSYERPGQYDLLVVCSRNGKTVDKGQGRPLQAVLKYRVELAGTDPGPPPIDPRPVDPPVPPVPVDPVPVEKACWIVVVSETGERTLFPDWDDALQETAAWAEGRGHRFLSYDTDALISGTQVRIVEKRGYDQVARSVGGYPLLLIQSHSGKKLAAHKVPMSASSADILKLVKAAIGE